MSWRKGNENGAKKMSDQKEDVSASAEKEERPPPLEQDKAPAQLEAAPAIVAASTPVEAPPRVFWADIAQSLGQAPLPVGITEKVDDGLAALTAAGFQSLKPSANAARPRRTPVYSGGIPRGPVGALRSVL